MGILSFLNRTPGEPDEQDMAARHNGTLQDAGKDDAADDEASFEIGKVPEAVRDEQRPAGTAPAKTDFELEHTFFSAIMDKLPDAVYFKDLQSRFLMVNNALAKKHFSQSDTAQSIGRTDFDFFTQEHARKAYGD